MPNSKSFWLPDGEDMAFGHVPVDPRTGNPALGFTFVDVMLGRVSGAAGLAVNAFRASMPNGSAGVVDEIARSLVTSAAGLAMTIRSTSAADVGKVVRIGPLGANYAPIDASNITLNGTTPVSVLSATPLTRINFLGRVSGDFVGDILVENGGTTYAYIAAGQQTMRSSQYCVAAGFRFFLLDMMSSLAKDTPAGTSCAMALQIKPAASVGFGSLSSWNLRQEGAGSFSFDLQCPQGLTGPIDLRAQGIATAANIDVQTLMTGMVQDLGV